MQFLKKHYEKIILSVVLLALAVAAALMPIKVASEQKAMDERKAQVIKAPAKALKPIDLTTNEIALARLKTNVDFELAGPHNLFNPVKWLRKPDGGLIKASEGGLRSVEITKITPLNIVVSLEEVSGEGANVRYQIGIYNELDRSPKKQLRIVTNTDQGRKVANFFTLKEVQGPPESPTNIVVTLQSNEKVPINVSKEKPFTQIIGYSADLKSDLFKLNRKNLRVKDQITLGDDTYNIVAIGRDEVVLSAQPNAKQTTLKYNAAQVK
jgi:hypothetical protein